MGHIRSIGRIVKFKNKYSQLLITLSKVAIAKQEPARIGANARKIKLTVDLGASARGALMFCWPNNSLRVRQTLTTAAHQIGVKKAMAMTRTKRNR